MPHIAMMRVSDEGVGVLQEREGMRLEAYQDSVGVWTIGLGHTSAVGPPVVYPSMVITEDEAWEIFWSDTEVFRMEAKNLVKVPMEQHQYDATASFVYNIGTTQFKSSTFLEKLNAGDYDGAAEAILMWNKPPEVMTRRQGEYYQFKDGTYFARCDAEGNPV